MASKRPRVENSKKKKRLGPSKGLQELKIGHDIILRRFLKMGNLGTKLVTRAIIHPEK